MCIPLLSFIYFFMCFSVNNIFKSEYVVLFSTTKVKYARGMSDWYLTFRSISYLPFTA